MVRNLGIYFSSLDISLQLILISGEIIIAFFQRTWVIEMKFHDVAIGQRFELDGAIFLKTSPVLASPEIGGSSKFMARYVAVRPLDKVARTDEAKDGRMIDTKSVREAFDAYHTACRQALAHLEGVAPGIRLESAVSTLDKARNDFLAAISR